LMHRVDAPSGGFEPPDWRDRPAWYTPRWSV